MTTTTEQQYVREWVGPFTHLWFDPAPAFRPSQTDCKEKNRSIFRNVPIHHAAARVLPRKKSVASGSERINRRCPYAVILVWRLRQASPQVALQIDKHLSQSVADLNLLFLNEFFCNDHWRAHRRALDPKRDCPSGIRIDNCVYWPCRDWHPRAGGISAREPRDNSLNRCSRRPRLSRRSLAKTDGRRARFAQRSGYQRAIGSIAPM